MIVTDFVERKWARAPAVESADLGDGWERVTRLGHLRSNLPTSEMNGRKEMGSGRIELPTSRLSGARSNHLSYEPQMRTAKY